MRRVVLFIAMSLDGCIADRDGRVDWLAAQGSDGEDAYAGFIQHVDTVVMGWNTYRQVVTELSPGQWPYGDLTAYVVTHRDLPSTDRIRFTGRDPRALVEDLRRQPGRDIWICGGASLVRQLTDSIDEYDISVIPVLLGGGVPLFPPAERSVPLELAGTRCYGGVAELIYRRRTAPCPPLTNNQGDAQT